MSRECLLVSVGAYWCLRVPNGGCGCLLVAVGAYWCLRMPNGGCAWVPTGV